MILPDHLPKLNPNETAVHMRRSSETWRTTSQLWAPNYFHDGISLMEDETAESQDIRFDYSATRGSRILQALAEAGMRDALEAVGLEGRTYPTPDAPGITTCAVAFPIPGLFINRANGLVKPNGPAQDTAFRLVPFQGLFRTENQFSMLARHELPFDITDPSNTHETVLHGPALMALMNSAVLSDEIHRHVVRLWTEYNETPMGPARYGTYEQMRTFTEQFDLCFTSPNFADLAVNPGSNDVYESFQAFFTWKTPDEIPPLMAAARMAVTNYAQPTE